VRENGADAVCDVVGELRIELHLQILGRFEVRLAVVVGGEPGGERRRDVDFVPVVIGGLGPGLELTFAGTENPFELLVVDDHDHALGTRDGALPGR